MNQQLIDPFHLLEKGHLVTARPLDTHEGWHDFVHLKAPSKPVIPSATEWEAMSAEARHESINARRQYHAKMPHLATPYLDEKARDILQKVISNVTAQAGVREGFFLDGYGTVGKSTFLTDIGRRYEKGMRSRNVALATLLEQENVKYLPVAYITLPGLVSPKAFCGLLLAFYGAPKASQRENEADLTQRVVDLARESHTTLILVDDIHFLKFSEASRSGHTAAVAFNNFLKRLQSSIHATFGYAGIEVRRSGLLLEGLGKDDKRASQTQHRFVVTELTAFEFKDPVYKLVLEEFERSLCLINHKEGWAAKHKGYIYARTQGRLGAIRSLFTDGANKAVGLKGKDEHLAERLSIELLERVTLAHGAEEGYKEFLKRKRWSAWNTKAEEVATAKL